jgi:hypothetical protein
MDNSANNNGEVYIMNKISFAAHKVKAVEPGLEICQTHAG